MRIVLSGAGAAGLGHRPAAAHGRRARPRRRRHRRRRARRPRRPRPQPRGAGRHHQPARRSPGSLRDALAGADVFIGVSAPGILDRRRRRDDGAGRHRVRAGQPRPGGRPGRGPAVGRGRRDRPQRRAEPDQQRAGLPRASSAACSTPAPATSTSRWRSPPPGRSPTSCGRTSSTPPSSSRASSTRHGHATGRVARERPVRAHVGAGAPRVRRTGAMLGDVALPRPAAPVQSVDRALRLLEVLAPAGGRLPITELAARSGLSLGTVHRLLAEPGRPRLRPPGHRPPLRARAPALLPLGDAATRLLGSWAHAVPVAARRALRARPATSRCSRTTTSSTSRRRPAGTGCACSPRSAAASLPHSTAVGKVLLAWQDPEPRAAGAACGWGSPGRTPHTLTTVAAFGAELRAGAASAVGPSTTRKRSWACAASPSPWDPANGRSRPCRSRRPRAGCRPASRTSSTPCASVAGKLGPQPAAARDLTREVPVSTSRKRLSDPAGFRAAVRHSAHGAPSTPRSSRMSSAPQVPVSRAAGRGAEGTGMTAVVEQGTDFPDDTAGRDRPSARSRLAWPSSSGPPSAPSGCSPTGRSCAPTSATGWPTSGSRPPSWCWPRAGSTSWTRSGCAPRPACRSSPAARAPACRAARCRPPTACCSCCRGCGASSRSTPTTRGSSSSPASSTSGSPATRRRTAWRTPPTRRRSWSARSAATSPRTPAARTA